MCFFWCKQIQWSLSFIKVKHFHRHDIWLHNDLSTSKLICTRNNMYGAKFTVNIHIYLFWVLTVTDVVHNKDIETRRRYVYVHCKTILDRKYNRENTGNVSRGITDILNCSWELSWITRGTAAPDQDCVYTERIFVFKGRYPTVS